MKQYLKQLAVFLICVSALILIAADKAAVAPTPKPAPAIAPKLAAPPVPAPVDIVIPFSELGITKDDVECDAPSEKRCVLRYSVPSIGSDDKVEIDLDTATDCSANETAIVCKGISGNSIATGVFPALSAALVAGKKADAKSDGALFYKLSDTHELADRAEVGAMLDAVASELFAQAAKTKTADQKIFELQWELADRAGKWRVAEAALLQATQKTSATQSAAAKGSTPSISEKSSATKASGDAGRVQTQTAQSQVVVGTGGVTAKSPTSASQTSGIKQEAMQPTGSVPPLRDSRQMDDRLAEQINNQNKKVHYDYDALGRLILRGGVGTEKTKTRLGYFGEMRTVEYNKDYPVSKIEYFNGQRGTEYIVETSKDAGNTITNVAAGYALHKDRLGSTTVVTSEKTGEVMERADYDPFGTTIVRGKDGKDADRSTIANSILYTGQYYDADAGLYLYRFRAYDPKLGKFLQRDPLGYSDGPNPTAYVMNSPHNFVDPLGLQSSGRYLDCISCSHPEASVLMRFLDSVLHPNEMQRLGLDPVKNFMGEVRAADVANEAARFGESTNDVAARPRGLDLLPQTSLQLAGEAVLSITGGEILGGVAKGAWGVWKSTKAAARETFLRAAYRDKGVRNIARQVLQDNRSAVKAELEARGVGTVPEWQVTDNRGRRALGNTRPARRYEQDEGYHTMIDLGDQPSTSLHELKHVDDILNKGWEWMDPPNVGYNWSFFRREAPAYLISSIVEPSTLFRNARLVYAYSGGTTLKYAINRFTSRIRVRFSIYRAEIGMAGIGACSIMSNSGEKK